MPYYQKACQCCLIKVHPRDVERFEASTDYIRKFEVEYWSGRDVGIDSDEEPLPSIQPAAIRAAANQERRVHWDDDDGEEPPTGCTANGCYRGYARINFTK